MPVEVNENQNIRHNGVYYKAGELIHDIEGEAKDLLVKSGAVKDLDGDSEPALADPEPSAADLEKKADEFGAPVEDQVAARAAADVEAAQATLAAPGEPVGPVQGQPSAADLASDPALQ